jgi:DNA/RNA endonuclease G (NUC1)
MFSIDINADISQHFNYICSLIPIEILTINIRAMNWKIWIHAISVSLIVLVSCGKTPDSSHVEKEASLKVTPAAPDVIPAAGGEVSLSVMSNVDWTVSGVPQWLTVSPDSGTGSNYKQPVTVVAEANVGAAREAVLTFKAKDVTSTVTISQNHSFGSDAPEGTVFFESFTKSIGAFTIKDVTVPSALKAVWEFTSQYQCMKATAYHNASAMNYASESWLISPDITLPAGKQMYFTFEHAGGYFGKASNEATVWISKNGGDWEQLEIASDAYPTTWTFITAGNWDMTPYAGSTVKIAFRYSSTATKAGTWEVRNVSILYGEFKEAEIPNVDPKKTSWMELPAMDNAAYGYYSHHFTMNKQAYRNYSFAWSQKDLVSVWVAYPLNKTYTNKVVDRTDAWAYDPILGKEYSAAPFSGYAGDYARGHQLPSADRLCCADANKQTFYGTNIAPQLNEHNEGIWSNLENRIRSVANSSDTTYVVTGCLVDGATEFSTDSDGKTVTIPVAFYKAVLRYKADGGDNAWTAAGFYTDHKKYSTSDLKAISMSIDELEKKTGHDFFVNLAGKIGADAAAAVETQDPKNYNTIWGM